MNFSKVSVGICLLFLVACGGGSGTSPAVGLQPLTPPSTPPTPTPLYNAEPLVAYDPDTYYSNVCTADTTLEPSIQFAIPTKLNDDEYTDFIVVYWCDLAGNSEKTTATPNILVAQVSDGMGGFTVENYDVFGASYPSISGASRKYAVGDFNNDGVDDYAFATNWEDGRNNESVYDAQPTVLLSNTNYTYDISVFGEPCWGHAVQSRPNNQGYDDALFGGYCGNQFQAYRLVNNEWVSTTQEYPVGLNQPASHWATDFQTVGTDSIVGTTCVFTSNETPPACGIGLFTEYEDWAMDDNYLTPVEFITTVTNWNGDVGPMDVMLVNDEQYLGIAASQMCVMDDATVIAMYDGWKPTVEVYEGGTYDVDDMDDHRFLLVFDIVDNKLVQREDAFVNEVNQYNANFFECGDINNDGLSDVVISEFSRGERQFGGKPMVYLNNGSKFVMYENAEEPMPGHSGVQDNAQGYLHDMNSDGYVDVVVFGETTATDGNIEIYTTTDYLTLNE